MRFEGSQLWDNPIWREARDQSVRNGIARRTIWIFFFSWTGISLDELPWKLLPSEQLFEAFRQKMYTVHCWKTTKIETFSSLQKRIYSIAVSSLRFAGFGSLLVGIQWHHNSHSWAVIVWCVVSNGSMVTPTRTPHQNMVFPVDCPLNQLWDPMNQKRTVSLSFH